MLTQVLKTLAHSMISLFLLFTFVFFMIRIMPGDPARLLGGAGASDYDVQTLRESLGLDRSVMEQFLIFVRNVAQGDFGRSIQTGQPVGAEILTALAWSFSLVTAAMLLAIAFAVPAGVVAAVKRNRLPDISLTSIAVASTSLPAFWLALILIEVFSVNLRLLPSGGTGDLRNYILPTVVLAATQVGLITRMTRASVVEVLTADYVRTARAKGVHPYRILLRHVLVNAAAPTVTVVGLQTGLVLAGSIVTETIFNWPGVGRLLIRAVQARDYPMIQALILVFGVAMVTFNLLADLLNMLIDPRLRKK